MPEPLEDIWSSLDPAIVEEIEERLLELQGDEWDRLSMEEIRAQYPTRDYHGGWRLRILFSDNFVRRIDVLVTIGYPTIFPRIALVDHPPRLQWPHVEGDGVLCLLDNSAAVDPNAPVQVLENLVDRSCRLVEELLEGSIIERDFKDEFLTYWNYDVNDGRHTYSLLAAAGPSRKVSIWHGKAFTVVAEDDASLLAWLHNRYPHATNRPRFEEGLFVWHDVPMLPRQYPQNAPQLLVEIERGGPAASAELRGLLPKLKGSLICLFAANGRYGPGICICSLDRPRDKARSHAKRDMLTNGFREGSLTPELAVQRFFARGSIRRGKIQRADPAWIHGRGRDERSMKLRASSVVIFGCGSVGSEVAASLLKAGVGTIHLVDNDRLEWANVGRHRLGGAQVGLLKANELAIELGRDFPHVHIVPHVANLESIVFEEPDWLVSSSLIVSTTGSGHADHALNAWHRSAGRQIPVVYGWTEPRAGAGHAVAIGSTGGCLNSGIDNLGRSILEMTHWQDSTIKMEEPACGVHFAPYGAIELGYINTLIADLALECLLGKNLTSTHRVWLARKSLLETNGGSWTPEALQAMAPHDRGGLVVDLHWAACGCCNHGKQVINAAAA